MKPGRNDPCPCGSGRKYKQCCLAKDEALSPDELTWRRVRREIDGLHPILFKEALRHFGPEGLDEAWAEFHLWESSLSEDPSTISAVNRSACT